MHFRRILVLGATGRIGRVLRRCWAGQSGFEHVMWQARQGDRSVQQDATGVVFDPLGAPEALARAATGASAILCLSGVTPARAAAGGVMADNIALAEAAIRAGASSGARVFLASSAAVYGNQPGVLDETCPLLPETEYGRSKVDMERRGAMLAAELGVQVCALRIGNIAGVDAILGGWKPGFQLDQFKDGRTPRRSYIGLATLARVLGDVIQALDVPDALNIAAPGVVEMGTLLDAASLRWSPRPAPKTAIAEVRLGVKRLQRFTPMAAQDTLPQVLVEEWRRLEPV